MPMIRLFAFKICFLEFTGSYIQWISERRETMQGREGLRRHPARR